MVVLPIIFLFFCTGYSKGVKTENNLLSCPGFCERDETIIKKVPFSLVFRDSVSNMVSVAKEIRERLKVRDKILDAG